MLSLLLQIMGHVGKRNEMVMTEHTDPSLLNFILHTGGTLPTHIRAACDNQTVNKTVRDQTATLSTEESPSFPDM